MVQHLISSVSKNPVELVEKMNINTCAVLVNQCDEDRDEVFTYKDNTIKVFHRNERGVGKSRNLCIEKSSEDILLFSDEDIVYQNGYEKSIVKMFDEHQEADLILFNVKVCKERRTYWNQGFKKVGRFNTGRYPAYSIAIRRKALLKSKVKYSELFGGGAKYSNGEDSLFLTECDKNKIRMYASDVVIGEEIPRESTWFKGYTEKFFYDRGVLFAFLYGKAAVLWAIRFALVKKEMFTGEIKAFRGFKLIMKGISRGYKEKKKHNK